MSLSKSKILGTQTIAKREGKDSEKLFIYRKSLSQIDISLSQTLITYLGFHIFRP